MNLYGFLLKWLPVPVAQILMAVWYLLLLLLVFLWFFITPGEFRYLAREVHDPPPLPGTVLQRGTPGLLFRCHQC